MSQLNNKKPIISWWRSSDPTKKINVWQHKLSDINIINTKVLTDEFIEICLKEKHRIFLHVNITGMGGTIFEPNIPTVKQTFYQLKKLIDNGFPQKQILVVVNPILPNDNGLNALKLLLKLFTEYKLLRLRFIRFSVLNYKSVEQKSYTSDKETFVIANDNILKRPSTKYIMQYLTKNASFFKDYYKLIKDYESIITVDKGEEALIGIRELIAFGYKNEWFDQDENGNLVRTKLIFYENGNKFKPIVNLLSPIYGSRCSNRCLLCPWKD